MSKVAKKAGHARARGALFTAVLAVSLLSCRRDPSLSPAVLTLLPTAFDGGSMRDGERCGRAGDDMQARLFVSAPTLTFTLRGRSEGGAAFAVAVGPASSARETAAPGEAVERTFRLQAPTGRQTVSVRIAEGELCLAQLALTQP